VYIFPVDVSQNFESVNNRSLLRDGYCLATFIDCSLCLNLEVAQRFGNFVYYTFVTNIFAAVYVSFRPTGTRDLAMNLVEGSFVQLSCWLTGMYLPREADFRDLLIILKMPYLAGHRNMSP
jgi:hypothetical protein